MTDSPMSDGPKPAVPHFGSAKISVGGIIGQGFGVLGRNFVPFGILALAFSLPGTLLESFSGSFSGLAGALLNVVDVLLAYLLAGALAYGAVQDLRGRHATISDCIGRGLGQLLPVLGVAILAFLIIALGTVLLVIPGIIAALMLFVAIPAAVVERPGVIASLHRSAELTRGNRWRVLGVLVVSLLIVVAVGAVGGGLSVLLSGGGDIPFSANWLQNAFFTAYWALLASVTYYHLRVAKEGLEADQLAAVFD